MEGIEGKIRSHSLKYIAEVGQKYLVGMLLLPPVTVYVVWEHVPLWLSASWFVASYLMALWRYVMVVKLRRLSTEQIDADYWGRQLTVSSFASGCLWGLAALLFFVPDALGVQLYLYVTVFALTSMTMIPYAHWIAAYYVFALPSLAGVFISLVSVGSAEYYAFSVLTVLFACVMLQVARNQQQLVTESLKLRFKQTELLEELRQQKQAAEAANLSKSKFLAAASHDLRQPLHSIGLFTAALGNRSSGTAERALIENIDTAVQSLDRLLNSLLDISKLDAGVISPRFEHVDLASVVQAMASEYEPQASAKGLRWAVRGNYAVVYSDPELLNTVLRNVISNAIRYTERGSIAIHCQPEEGGVVVRIMDTGLGIPAVRQKDIFQEFFQLSNPSQDSAKGVGLGLAIVERLARLLSIEVTLASEPGAGTEFALRVPAGDRQKCKPQNNTQPTAPHDGAGALIMVIDNNPEVLLGMKALLKSWHYKVLCVPNESKALRAIALTGLAPNVMVSDYQLEDGVTGVEVLNSLARQLDTAFDAIILTGDTSQECILDAHKNHYKILHKPVVPAKLRATLINLKLQAEKAA